MLLPPREPFLPIEDKWPDGEQGATGIGSTKTSADLMQGAENAKWVNVSDLNKPPAAILSGLHCGQCFYDKGNTVLVAFSLARNTLNGLPHKKQRSLVGLGRPIVTRPQQNNNFVWGGSEERAGGP